MLRYLILFVFFLTSHRLQAQDERYYRDMLAGDLVKKEGSAEPPRFFVAGDAYLIDLNSDGIEERIIPQKRDGVDWIEIQDSSHNVLFSGKLLNSGADSHLFRIKFVYLTPKVKVLILFFDEGVTRGRKIEAQAITYLISFENNDLSTMKMQKGARFFHEVKAQRDQYFRRSYDVNVFDVDLDGEREITIEYQHIQRIFKYAGNGDWRIY